MSDARIAFLNCLKETQINPATVDFDDGFYEGYNLRRERYGWSVFVRERGVESDTVGLPSEEDALAYLYEQITQAY